jgi:hypothetical protein
VQFLARVEIVVGLFLNVGARGNGGPFGSNRARKSSNAARLYLAIARPRKWRPGMDSGPVRNPAIKSQASQGVLPFAQRRLINFDGVNIFSERFDDGLIETGEQLAQGFVRLYTERLGDSDRDEQPNCSPRGHAPILRLGLSQTVHLFMP